MDFKINLHITADPQVLEAVNRIADALMGGGVKKLDAAPWTPPASEKVEDVPVCPPPVKDIPEDKGTINQAEAKQEPTAEQQEEPAISKGIRPDYTEPELMDMPMAELLEILTSYKINPNEFEGKNTNRKLRLLVLEAQQEKEEANQDEPGQEEAPEDEPEQEEAPEEQAEEVKPEPQSGVTVETVRMLLVSKVQAGKQGEAKTLLLKYGCKNVTEVGTTPHLGAFYNELLKL
jgi:hypothetical protein